MTEPNDLGRRLVRHLSGVASDEEREQLERQALEDDHLFDQLEALESELVDAYVRGELDPEDQRGVARLLDVSSRTRAVADTTMALDVRGEVPPSHPAEPLAPTRSRPVAPGPMWWRNKRAAVTLLVVACLGLGLALLVGQARAQASANEALRKQMVAQEARLAQLEEANRALALRLARLESGVP